LTGSDRRNYHPGVARGRWASSTFRSVADEAGNKNYFVKYDEYISNDFVLSDGGRKIELLHNDLDSWRITFVDTGRNSTIGQRLRLVRPHLEGEDELFEQSIEAPARAAAPRG
jgi:hypothetical protein